MCATTYYASCTCSKNCVCCEFCFLSEFSENQNEKEKREKEGKRLIWCFYVYYPVPLSGASRQTVNHACTVMYVHTRDTTAVSTQRCYEYILYSTASQLSVVASYKSSQSGKEWYHGEIGDNDMHRNPRWFPQRGNRLRKIYPQQAKPQTMILTIWWHLYGVSSTRMVKYGLHAKSIWHLENLHLGVVWKWKEFVSMRPGSRKKALTLPSRLKRHFVFTIWYSANNSSIFVKLVPYRCSIGRRSFSLL